MAESSFYALAGNRPGFVFSGLERVDFPPNAGGHLYTEFRRPDGGVQAVVLTALLWPRGNRKALA